MTRSNVGQGISGDYAVLTHNFPPERLWLLVLTKKKSKNQTIFPSHGLTLQRYLF
jgi:hypothetical protein